MVADIPQHSKRKRIFADRYTMSSIMKEKSLETIRERAMAFVRQCAAAGQSSVDVYVCQVAMDRTDR